MSDCTDCILDLTDACSRGSGRAIDDDICDSFISRETYEVNKNDSWQLGYQQGKEKILNKLQAELDLLNVSDMSSVNMYQFVCDVMKIVVEER